MKNKKITTYLLLAASVIIWGTITWRVIRTFKKEEVIMETKQPLPTVLELESVVLLLNYEDPFLKKIEIEILPEEDESNYPDIDFYQQEPEVVEGPAFKFKGILKARQASYGLLDLGGETVMVTARERLGDFYIVSITADKIVVRKQGLDIELFAE